MISVASDVDEFWPLMKTDERGVFDSSSQRGIGAVLEVSNALGAGALCSENSAFASLKLDV